MGDMREMLLKAGLVTEEQAKKAEAKVRPPERPGAGRKPEGRGPERGPQGGQGRERAPREAPPAVSLTREESQRLLKVAQAGKVEGKTRGNRRWYFVSRQGRVPYLELSDEVVKDLEQGNVAIAESERGEAWLVTGECARQLAEVDPAWVRTPR